ncbi:MAG: hypothetical protein ACRDKX_01640 [Solirubrobacterales bacterium]
MGEYTLKVPAEHVQVFRENVYGRLAGEGTTLDTMAGTLSAPTGESWAKHIAGDPDKIERYAAAVLKSTRNIATLAEVMEQLEWTDPIEGAIELTIDSEVLGSVIEGCLTDVGAVVHDITDAAPFDRAAFDAATARGTWLADRRAEVEAVAH